VSQDTATAAEDTDRNNSFQILADGTQELSALLGLFATESVENYAVDFDRPFLAVAMASASMLGVLGWIQAMVGSLRTIRNKEEDGNQYVVQNGFRFKGVYRCRLFNYGRASLARYR